MARDYPDIPWQISHYAMTKLEKAHAFCAANVAIVISDPVQPALRIHGLFSRSANPTELREALAAVLHRFPEREFFVPQIWPEDFDTTIFEPLAFIREPLTQFFMRREI